MGINGSVARRLLAAPALLALLVAVVVAGADSSRGLAQGGTPGAGPTSTPDPTVVAVERAASYLLGLQADDGGFVGFSGETDPGTTADAVVALKAADVRGVAVTDALEAAAGYLEEQAADYAATGAGAAAKLALAAVALGRDPASFGGVDLLGAATGGAVGTPAAGTPAAATPAAATPVVSGVYGTGLYDHALVLLALGAVNEPAPEAAIEALRATQNADGAWAFDGSTEPGGGDSNTTALVVQALVATGNGDDPMVEAALDYLRSVQTVTGQFAFGDADPLVADANSTALAVQAIIAASQDPASADEWNNAASGLAAFQNVSGAFRYQDTDPADNLLATLQAIPALAGLPLPVVEACEETAEAGGATPVVALPAPASGEAPCVVLEPAA